jgi:clan AA aspartic protease
VASLAGGPFERLEALVDTGATYTWVPKDVLERLGAEPEEQWPFVLADGREVTYPIGGVRLRYAGRTRATVAVFGEPDSEPRLGVVTLEELGLAADPVHRRLIPVPGLLKLA